MINRPEDKRPVFNADNAEECFTQLRSYYKKIAKEIFDKENEKREKSDPIYSADYQKWIGRVCAMDEVLEYFSKFKTESDL